MMKIKITLCCKHYTFPAIDELLSATVDIGRRRLEENGTVRQTDGSGASKGNARKSILKFELFCTTMENTIHPQSLCYITHVGNNSSLYSKFIFNFP